MSIRDHKEEVKRWIDNPDGTKVWFREAEVPFKWDITDNPEWSNNKIYIVDDKHSELRKEWIDRGKPPVQIWNDTFEEWDDYNGKKPEWYIFEEYRIKPSEWDTPEWEDPIKYHAKRIDPDWKADWCNYEQAKWFIYYIGCECKYRYDYNVKYAVTGTVYMSDNAAKQIVEALNSGELTIKETK